MAHNCFKYKCSNEAQYVCLCSLPKIFSCELHLSDHLKIPNRNHIIDSIFIDTSQGTKDAILCILAKEKSKNKKLKKNLKERKRKLNLESSKISEFIEKISKARKISKFEEDPELKLLVLQSEDAIKKAKEVFPAANPYEISAPNEEIEKDKCFENQNQSNSCSSQITSTQENLHEKINKNKVLTPKDLKIKRPAILRKANRPELEQEFKKPFSLPARLWSIFNQPFSHYSLNSYHEITSLYLTEDISERDKWTIYHDDSDIEEEKSLDILEYIYQITFITQLLNGEIFCYGCYKYWIPLIIDKIYSVRYLPTEKRQYCPSGVYYNNNIYCFEYDIHKKLLLSNKFDLNKNQWINLRQIEHNDNVFYSVIFNRNVLVSGYSKNIFLYSIDLDDFSTIPYEFAEHKRKILKNAGRSYLFECDTGFIYESEDEFNWKRISISTIKYIPIQSRYIYNIMETYISEYEGKKCYKFDLSEKVFMAF